MNLRKSLMIAALPALMFTACKQTESAAPESAAKAEKTTAAVAAKPETASFKIDGMVCAVGCAKTIEKKLSSMEGVTKATVDFDKKQATVEFDAAVQSPEKLVEAVEKTGDGKTYKVSDLKASADHAALFVSHEKEKEKDKKDGCGDAKEARGGCCAAKKSCHSA